MTERNDCPKSGSYGSARENVCVDVNHILDSCRDRDCFENLRVWLTECGQETIEKTNNIRIRAAHVAWTQLTVEPVQFNRGFYSVGVRFYVHLSLEGCLCPGRTQDFEGIAVAEKRVILYGSEGCVSIFKSEPGCGGFCAPLGSIQRGTNLPVAVAEVADPVVLDAVVGEKCGCCCCSYEEIPEYICSLMSEKLVEGHARYLTATLGFFSVIRLERPGQYMINATEYCVPDKECLSPEENDPCALFRKMAFPTNEFCPPPLGGC